MGEETNYPDSPPDTLGDLKDIKRLPGMNNRSKIKWGDEYRSWPIEKRLDYAERLAASMNNAASVLQDERNNLLEVARSQEKQLEQAKVTAHQSTQIMHQQIAQTAAEKQQLYNQIVQLQSELKQSRIRIKELSGG